MTGEKDIHKILQLAGAGSCVASFQISWTEEHVFYIPLPSKQHQKQPTFKTVEIGTFL